MRTGKLCEMDNHELPTVQHGKWRDRSRSYFWNSLAHTHNYFRLDFIEYLMISLLTLI